MKEPPRGYQVVEPRCLNNTASNARNIPIEVAMLEWAIDKLRANTPEYFENVDIEVIAVTYLGTYPAIGIHYKQQCPVDLEEKVSSAIDAIVENYSFDDFWSFVKNSDRSWDDVWKDIKGTR